MFDEGLSADGYTVLGVGVAERFEGAELIDAGGDVDILGDAAECIVD